MTNTVLYNKLLDLYDDVMAIAYTELFSYCGSAADAGESMTHRSI
jgi:hypothetical protein